MRLAALGVVALLAACGSVTVEQPSSSDPTVTGEGDAASVTSVTDGDTLDVTLVGRAETVRLVGIDAPERGECFADEATDELRRLVGDRDVRLVRDVSDRDDHGRLLRHVFVDDLHVNRLLVRDGYALARRYPPDTARADELEEAEERARAEGAGLWGRDGCRSPVAAEVVLAVRADAPGDDGRNPNGEWLDIRNVAADPLDLSGWTVRDGSASKRYRFDDGTTIAAGASLRLRSGCGTDSATERYWCHEGSAVWNNGGDTAMLLDAEGRIVATHRYGPDR